MRILENLRHYQLLYHYIFLHCATRLCIEYVFFVCVLLVQIVHMHHIVYCYMTHPLKNDMTDGRLNFGEDFQQHHIS